MKTYKISISARETPKDYKLVLVDYMNFDVAANYGKKFAEFLLSGVCSAFYDEMLKELRKSPYSGIYDGSKIIKRDKYGRFLKG